MFFLVFCLFVCLFVFIVVGFFDRDDTNCRNRMKQQLDSDHSHFNVVISLELAIWPRGQTFPFPHPHGSSILGSVIKGRTACKLSTLHCLFVCCWSARVPVRKAITVNNSRVRVG